MTPESAVRVRTTRAGHQGATGQLLALLLNTDALIINNLCEGFQDGTGKLEQCSIVSHENNGFSRAERGVQR